MQGKVNVVFVVGGPGCGKGTQCAKIKTAFNFEHVSTGYVLRNIVKNKTHPKWKELEEKMNSGQFVSSAELIGFVKDTFKDYAGKKVLLDGFPRNQENIDEWNKQMTDVADVKALLYFECSGETMKKRMLGRNEGRADDNEATIAKRISNFEQQTVPVIAPFEKEGKVIKINAEQGKDEVYAAVEKELKAKGL